MVIGRILRTVSPATSRTPYSSRNMARAASCLAPAGIDPPRLRRREARGANPAELQFFECVYQFLTSGGGRRDPRWRSALPAPYHARGSRRARQVKESLRNENSRSA